MIRAIVTDIEGTTSSLDFVRDTLFPFAAARLPAFVRAHQLEREVAQQLAEVNHIAGSALGVDEAISLLQRWMTEDRKYTPLKSLQGMVWRAGYEAGELRGHVYPDVVPRLRTWHAVGVQLYVYSSGSEQAQRLLFGHSEQGDLTPLFTGYFDTRIGAKADVAAYERIRERLALPAETILFLSDVTAELDAARGAGLCTCQLVRDARCVAAVGHAQARSFDEVAVA